VGHREFFNSLADKWDDICRHDSDRISLILDLIGLAEGDSVLDVGTGTGILVPYLMERIGPSGSIVAVDIAEEMLAVAKSKNQQQNVTFIHGDVLDTPHAKERYDHVICFSVFPHFRDKRSAVNILSRYLKAGGRLTICHSQGREAINNLHRSSHPAVAEDYLPEMDAVKELSISARLEPYISVDSNSMYLVSVRKPVAGENAPAEPSWDCCL
jgi:demethylmenaquinone methyltransferase/2-methoxy-6-polyprenyl-1,4-benzoquinol methylase